MRIVFFEKPGCAGNARQKSILLAMGHEIEARSLLKHPFTREELMSFFGQHPVSDWFNRSAPRIKSGEVRPELLDADTAMNLLLAEPLLIRRPLMEFAGKRCVGFDLAEIEQAAGPYPATDRLDALRGQNLEQCQRERTGYRCPDAGDADTGSAVLPPPGERNSG